MRKSFLVLFIFIGVFVLVLALSLQRVVLAPDAPEQEREAGNLLAAIPSENKDSEALTAKGLDVQPTVTQETQEIAAPAQSSSVGTSTRPIRGPSGIEGLALQLSQPIMVNVSSVRGLAVTEQFLYISAVDAERHSALLYQIHRDKHTVAQVRDLARKGWYAIGGIHMGDRFLWVPLAEGEPGESQQASFILAIEPQTLEVRQSIRVLDAIRAIARGTDGYLYGLNSDSTVIYKWDLSGREMRAAPVSTGAHYQDMEIVRGNLVCAGTDANSGVIDVIDPSSLTLLTRHRCHARFHTGRPGGSFVTSQGFGFADGVFYFLLGSKFPTLMSYVLDGVSPEEYVPSAGS